MVSIKFSKKQPITNRNQVILPYGIPRKDDLISVSYCLLFAKFDANHNVVFCFTSFIDAMDVYVIYV